MPIVFVHGVAARQDDHIHLRRWQKYDDYLRYYVAPVIAPDPENVAITMAYWGDVGVKLAWGGASCPPLVIPTVKNHPFAALLAGGRRRDFWAELGKRSLALPGGLVAKAIAIMRHRLNQEQTVFVGDALQYFAHRGTAARPGPIPLRVLTTLAAARANQRQRPGEPLVVMSHSLGGQIIYDIVTHFLPNLPDYANIRIDFWAATASQVGLFEELKLFLASSAEYGPHNPVPFPDKRFLGGWWNVWDPHDFLSFTVNGLIAGVDDEFFDSGLWLTEAHYAGIEQPSFYIALAHKLKSYLAAQTLGNAITLDKE